MDSKLSGQFEINLKMFQLYQDKTVIGNFCLVSTLVLPKFELYMQRWSENVTACALVADSIMLFNLFTSLRIMYVYYYVVAEWLEQ